jgi:hypothetical protein
MSNHYAREKFYLAVRGLAVGEGDARKRLEDAYVYNLINVGPEDLLPDQWKRFEKIKKVITTKVPPEHFKIGSVHFTLRSMKNKRVAKLIEEIVKIAEEIEILGFS